MSSRTSYTTSMNLRDKPTFENFIAICKMLGYTSVANEKESGSPTAFGRSLAQQYPYVIAGVLAPVMNTEAPITEKVWSNLIEAARQLGYTGGTESPDAKPFAQMVAMLLDMGKADADKVVAFMESIREETHANSSDMR